MTDRLPIVDGAPACPFVAFEDDRDGRALAPDHRHRCFAEPRPAQRALAHQEAYCLSSAFPVCPTFQDWARREAAAARPAATPEEPGQRDEPPVSRPLPPREREPRHAPGTDTPPPVPPRRHQPREWAAPPPWSDDAGTADDAGAGPIWGAAGTQAASGAAGTAGAVAGPSAGSGPAASEVEPPAFLAPRAQSRGGDAWGTSSRGLAGSAADRLAGPGDIAADRAGDAVVAPSPPRSGTRGPARDDEDEAGDEWVSAAAAQAWSPPPPRTAATPRDRRPGARRDPAVAPSRRDQRRRPEEEAAELFGPAWEKPRRYEAYPSLRTRVGLPSFSRLWIGVVALVLAGAVLFFAGPLLLGLGDKSPGTGGGGASPTASVSPSASASPTLAPAPTPRIYIVETGDTMSSIADKFKVTVEALKEANPQIKNIDRIKVGQEITIPVPEPDDVPSEVGESEAP